MKNKKIKIVLIIIVLVIISELIGMYIIYKKRDSKIVYIDTLNSINLVDDYYIGVGSSNFHNSRYIDMKIYNYNNNKVYAEQAKLVKYDNELNIEFESTFDSKYDSTFYDSVSVDSNIYVVGSYVKDEKQIELKVREGLLVKYNSEGKKIWSKDYQVLGDTEFKKIIDVSDGIVVVGQSIYENLEIGNHDTGGGIIVKYDYDGNIIWFNNFGGNKSGIFNDIIQVDDGYICVGKDAVNYGLIVKYSLDGKRLWIKNYEFTDYYGMMDIKKKDDKLYIAGSYKKEENNHDACIFIYDLNGEYIDKYTIGGSSDEKFNSVILLDNSLIGIGYTMSKDIKITGLKYHDKMSEGMLVEFDYSGKIINTKSYSGSKNETLNDIIVAKKTNENLVNKTNNYIVVGYTNSKTSLFKGNNKDYISRVLFYDNKLNLLEEK